MSGGIQLTQNGAALVPVPGIHPAPINIAAGVLCYLSFSGTPIPGVYTWALPTKPATDPTCVLSSSSSPGPTFLPQIDNGSYSVTLVDEHGNSYTLDIVTPTIGPTPAQGVSTFVTTIAGLRALTGSTSLAAVMVSAYSTIGDGGGGHFGWTTDTVTADDGGTFFVPTALPRVGGWQRLHVGEYLCTPWFGVLFDTGTTNNGPLLAAAITACNTQRKTLLVTYPANGGECWCNAGSTFPVMTTGTGMVGNDGTTPAIKIRDAGTDGDIFVFKGGSKTVRNLSVVNKKTSAFSALSAVFRFQNSNNGTFQDLYAASNGDNCSGIMLEHVYDGSAADASFIAHIGCWYNNFKNVNAIYNTIGHTDGNGLHFRVDSSAIGVVNPPGQTPGTYTGSVAHNTVTGGDIENKSKGLYLENQCIGNVFTTIQFLGSTDQIYARGASANVFIGNKHNQWDYAAGSALNFDLATSTNNCFLGLFPFNTPATPWRWGRAGASWGDTFGASPLGLTNSNGHALQGLMLGAPDLLLSRAGTVAKCLKIDDEAGGGGILWATSGSLYRPDGAGAGIVLGNGTNTFNGFQSWNSANAARVFSMVDSNQVLTTDATLTDLLTFNMPAVSTAEVEFVATARRTGGARGTGAVGDTAGFRWRGTFKRVAAGAPVQVGATFKYGGDNIDADPTAAGVAIQFVLAANGDVHVEATGAVGLNLQWDVDYRVRGRNV